MGQSTQIESQRTCNKCGATKDLTTGFYRNRTSYYRTCKECTKASRRKPRKCAGCNVIYFHIGSKGSRRKVCDDCAPKGKFCTRCEVFKPLDNFYKKFNDVTQPRAFSHYCIPCSREVQIEIRYKVPYAKVAEMFTAADDRCEICGDETGNLHIDHCHDSELVRGILCALCNRGLGQFRDSQDLLVKAISYLKTKSPSRV